MEAEAREPDPAIVRSLLEAAHRFSFFRAVQLLERADPDCVPIGGGGPPGREGVRLRPDLSFSFPRAAVTGVQEMDGVEDGRRRFLITQTLMGLYGIRTPLPEVYAEELLRRDETHDAVRDFLDLFHHRLLSLLYRAWARCRPQIAAGGDGAPDPLGRIVFALGGLADEAVRGGAGLPPRGLVRYTVFLARPSRPAEGLEKTLSDLLEGEPVRVEPYVLRAVAVPGDQRARLGASGCTLGEDFSLGERVEDRSGRFRLWIGPLDRAGFLSLAPEGEVRAVAGALIRLYLVDPVEHDAMLGILGAQRPPFRLVAGEGATRLGIDTWLGTEDPGDSWVRFPGFPAGAPDTFGEGWLECAGAAPAPREGNA